MFVAGFLRPHGVRWVCFYRVCRGLFKEFCRVYRCLGSARDLCKGSIPVLYAGSEFYKGYKVESVFGIRL